MSLLLIKLQQKSFMATTSGMICSIVVMIETCLRVGVLPMDLFEQEDPSYSSSSSDEALKSKGRKEEEYNLIPAPEPNISRKQRSLKKSKNLLQTSTESEGSVKQPSKSQKGRRIKNLKPVKAKTKHIVHHTRSNSQSGSESSIASASDIKEIKDSLKEHFDAIKSLQNALSFSDLRMFEPGENKSKNDGPDLKEKLELIERALYSLGKRFDQSNAVFNRASSQSVKKSSTKLENIEPLGNENKDQVQKQAEAVEVSNSLDPHPNKLTIPPPPVFTHTSPNRSSFPAEGAASSVDNSSSPVLEAPKVIIPPTHIQISESVVLDRLKKLETRVDSVVQQLESKMIKSDNRPPQDVKRLESMFGNLQTEMQKMRHDFMLQQKLNEQLVDLNYGLEQKVKELQSFIAGLKDNKTLEPSPMPAPIDENMIRQTCKSMLKKYYHAMNESLMNKVDMPVLEELAHHIATKDDLRKYTKKAHIQKLLGKHAFEMESVNSNTQQELHQQLESNLMMKIQRLEIDLDTKIRNATQSIQTEKRPKIDTRTMNELELRIEKAVLNKASQQLELKLEKWISAKSKELTNQIQDLMKLGSGNTARNPTDDIHPVKVSDLDMNPIVRQLTRDFDEKLYVLCTELSSCKQNFAAQALQPFYRCAQWLWTCGTLKLGSAVPWNIETTNTGFQV
jgi:hypothetical protein